MNALTDPRPAGPHRIRRKADMKRWITVAAITAVIAAGCGPPGPEAKEQALNRWAEARAKVLCGVGMQHLKTGQLRRAQNKAIEALALQENYLEARILLAKVYIEQGHYQVAIRELDAALKQRPDLPEIHYLLGAAQEKAGLLEAALRSYRRAHALDTSDPSGILAATEVLVTIGRFREAQLYLDSYLHLAGSDPGMYELAGRVAMMQEDYEQAARFYQQASDLKPRNVRYREALGRAQFHAGSYAAALETLDELKRVRDYVIPVWGHTMIGDCQMALKRPYEARDAYYAASELHPSSPGVWANLAKAALTLQDAPRAILTARQALNLDAGCLDALLVLGYALLREGQIPRAVGVLEGAVAQHPNSGTVKCLLGRAYAAQGNGAEAARCYAAALRAEPDNALARELVNGDRTPDGTKRE